MRLKPTSESVLVEGETLGHLIIDERGALTVTHAVLQSTISAIVGAINTSHDHVVELIRETEELHDTVDAIKQHVTKLDLRMHDCEDHGRETRVQLATLMSNMEAQDEDDGSVDGKILQDMHGVNAPLIMERLDDLTQRVDVVETVQKDVVARQGEKLDECRSALRVLEGFVNDSVDLRLVQLDDSLTAHKMEHTSLRNGFQEFEGRVAWKADLHGLEVKIERCIEDLRAEHSVLEHLRMNIVKLDECLELGRSGKSRVHELARTFQDESHESREWSSRNFRELREAIQRMRAEIAAYGHIEELREEFKKSIIQLSETTSRMEIELRRKADAGDLVRVQTDLQAYSAHVGRPRQLLLGKRCLACDRDADVGELTDQPVAEADRARQQEELFRGVQDAIKKAEFDPDGPAPMKYISVHIGSPAWSRGKDGVGNFEARNTRDVSPGSHRVIRPPGSKPIRPSTGPAAHKVSPRFMRTPRKEVPPLARLHHLREPMPPGLPSPTIHQSLRLALGSAPLPQEAAMSRRTNTEEIRGVEEDSPTMAKFLVEQPTASGGYMAESFVAPQAARHWTHSTSQGSLSPQGGLGQMDG